MLLDNALDSKCRLRLLRELATHPDFEYTVGELSNTTEMHRVQISPLLKKLEATGAVKIRRKGKVKLVSINKSNYYVKEFLMKLFAEEAELPIRVAREFAKNIKKKGIFSILLFGSSVKKKFGFKSDLDIMIITEHVINKAEINKIADSFFKKGALITFDTISLREFRKIYKEKEPSIVTLIRNHLLLYGKNPLEAT